MPDDDTAPNQAWWESLSPFKRDLWALSWIKRQRKVDEPHGRVFHYTSAGAFEKLVESGTFRLSNAAYLNDQGELTYPPRIARVVVRQIADLHNDGAMNRFFAEVFRTLESHVHFKNWYVASFSTEGNRLSQWRAYCSQGGYSIGLDPVRTAATIKALREFEFGPVIYAVDEQMRIVRERVNHHIHLWKTVHSRHPDVPQEEYDCEVAYCLGLRLSEDFMFFKSDAFKEEAEWRLVRYHLSGERVNFYERRGMLTPYLECSLISHDGRLPISIVHVSALGDQQLAAHAAGLALARKGYPNHNELISVPDFQLRF